MKYTFLMPAYKATYMHDAIESILKQTITDFRLIISDDCSPENLESIVNTFNDIRIYYRRNKKNIGGKKLVEHWNLLLDMCDTEYCILAPDDDLYAPTFLEEIDKLTIKYPQVDVLKSRAKMINAEGEMYQCDRLYDEYITQIDNIYHQTLPDHISGIGNYVFKTSVLKDIGGFVDYPLAWWSDVMSNVYMSQNGMAVTKDVLFSVRNSGINISSQKATKAEIRMKTDGSLQYYEDIQKLLYSKNNLSLYEKHQINSFKTFQASSLFWSIVNSASTFTIKEFWELKKKYKEAFATKYDTWVFLRKKYISK